MIKLSFLFILKVGFVLPFKKYWTRTGRLSIFFNCLKTVDQEFFSTKNCRTPSAQIFCCLQTSNTQNRKYGAYRESLSILEEFGYSFSYWTLRASIGLVLGVSSKPPVRWTGSSSFLSFLEAYFACCEAITTYFICLSVCLWIFVVEI